MKKYLLFWVCAVISVPVFAAITCTERKCLETKNQQVNKTMSADTYRYEIHYANQRVIEIEDELIRDKITYQDKKQELLQSVKDAIRDAQSNLTRMKNNGANITDDDYNGTIPVQPIPPEE